MARRRSTPGRSAMCAWRTESSRGAPAPPVDGGPIGDVRVANSELSFGAGADVLVAIRPEKFTLSSEPPGGDVNVVEGRMGPTAYLGDRSHLYINIAGREQPVAVAMQNLADSTTMIAPNQPVWLSWSENAIVLLPSEDI